MDYTINYEKDIQAKLDRNEKLLRAKTAQIADLQYEAELIANASMRYARKDLLGKRNCVMGRIRGEEGMIYNFYTEFANAEEFTKTNRFGMMKIGKGS